MCVRGNKKGRRKGGGMGIGWRDRRGVNETRHVPAIQVMGKIAPSRIRCTWDHKKKR